MNFLIPLIVSYLTGNSVNLTVIIRNAHKYTYTEVVMALHVIGFSLSNAVQATRTAKAMGAQFAKIDGKCKICVCGKCGGSGHISDYNHVRQGVCFSCQGAGTILKRIKTREQWQHLIDKAVKVQLKRQDAASERQSYIKQIITDGRIFNSPRLTVDKSHPYFEQHAIETYEWHEKFGWDM